MLATEMPDFAIELHIESSSISPDNRPSLPTEISLTPSSLHFNAIAWPIIDITSSFISSG